MGGIRDFSPLDEPELRYLPELFEQQVARTPEVTALVFADQQLSYRELNEQANQLARFMRACGVGPEVLVGIYMERSLLMVVTLLGVWKAGGAYVPLDPAYPEKRLTYMAHDARLALVLTQESLCEKLPTEIATTTRVVIIDQNWPGIAQESTDNPQRCASLSNLSHIIYTSGSTGQPKGVAIQHSNVAAFVDWAMSIFSSDDLAGTLASTSICFDLSIFELFVPLLCGGTVLLVENILHFFSAPLAKRVTLVNTVPSALSELIQIHALPPTVRCVNLAGEPLPASLAQRLYQQGTIQRIYNLYGPSECTTYSTIALIERGDSRTPSLGFPIARTLVYIVDQQMKLVTGEEIGEIYIGGAGVARGYLGHPELTAQRFVPDPFSHLAGALLYKTGDLACYRADGEIEFLGREDQQIKIRGFRIESGEIEEALRAHPGVREAALVARNAASGQKYLMAYIVAQSTSTLTAYDLQNTLRQKLPAYMIPSLFIFLDILPRLPNSKIDYPKLATLDIAAEEQRAVAAPRNAEEKELLVMWQEILSLQYIGIHDHFLDLGGHSLQAMHILWRIQETFNLAIPYHVFLQLPTIAEQAAYLLGHRETEPAQEQSERTIQQGSRRGNSVPLSIGQQALWSMEQFGLRHLAYNIPVVFQLRGQLDIAIFQRCVQEIVNRYEILRTTFHMDANGQPVQVIKPVLRIDLPLTDLRTLSASARLQEMQHLTWQAAQTHFDLAQGPLLRGRLVLLSENENAFLLTIHHTVADGWSLEVYQQALVQLYQDFIQGRASSLAALPIQYGDFALWQRRWLGSADAESQFAYWQRQLADAPMMTKLPSDHRYPAQPTFKRAQEVYPLSESLTQQLEALSRREGVTLYTLLLCAFKIFLYRYTGQRDIMIGAEIASRRDPRTAQQIGHFVNLLTLRTYLSQDHTFFDALQQVRKTVLEATAHQDLHFGQLVECLQLKRDLGSTPLFDMSFSLHHALKPMKIDDNLFIEVIENDPEQMIFDFEVLFVEKQGELSCAFHYALELFEAATIRRMMRNFQCLLEGIARQPQQHLSELPLLSEAEREQVLFAWNATHYPLPKSHCLHELFEQQTTRTPEATAVVFDEQQLSYQELNKRANQLARYLQKLGVGPEKLVGICIDRSLEMVVGLLGILKAGGAYVPLDPTYPARRLDYMIKNADLTIVITKKTLLEILPVKPEKIVCLDSDWFNIASESSGNLENRVKGHNLAYVIYTSGSTGQPRGVLVTHYNVVNHSSAIARYFNVGSTDRCLQFSSLSFDALTEEVFPTWLSGAALILHPKDLFSSFELFQAWLAEQEVSIVDLPTAYWHMWVQALEYHPLPLPPSLRLVLIGGEKAEPERWQQWQSRFSSTVRLSNSYGPTEATVTATLYETPTIPSALESPDVLPIGQPLANVQCYVLDASLQPVPAGVSGDLYLGGAGVARGYLGLPGMTAASFVPDPFSEVPGKRMYRTGDRVYQRADGQIVYVGREDEQIKWRGFRIEIGEITTVLQELSEVQEAVIVLREDYPGDQRLVAYLIPTRWHSLSVQTVRAALRKSLPAYMLPSAFVIMETWPLTPNGKVDKQALPPPDTQKVDQNNSRVPRNPLEEILVSIWCDVLKLNHVGIDDHILELGGHSLLAIQIAFRVRQIFQVNLPLQIFFQLFTVANLAEYIMAIGKETGIDVMQIAQIMTQINRLSDEEVKAMLAGQDSQDRLK